MSDRNDLRALSDAATKGTLSWEQEADGRATVYAGRVDPIGEMFAGIPMYRHGLNLFGRIEPDSNGPANLNFITALWNDYRSGHLLPAPSYTDDDYRRLHAQLVEMTRERDEVEAERDEFRAATYGEAEFNRDLVTTLRRLEDACQGRTELVTGDLYDASLRIPGMTDALYELDDARRIARDVLKRAEQSYLAALTPAAITPEAAGRVTEEAVEAACAILCAEVNDIAYADLPEQATYLERKTHVDRAALDREQARGIVRMILAAVALEPPAPSEKGGR